MMHKLVENPQVLSRKHYERVNAVNAKSAFLILKASAKYVERGRAIITIVTALLAAFTSYRTSYASSKAPVEHSTRGVAKELQEREINVNALAPGPMDTPLFSSQESSESVEYHRSQATGGRLTDVKDIAPIVKFLRTEGKRISGQIIFANGGYTTL